MTQSPHGIATATGPQAVGAGDGRAPRGMWAVAWRLHRWQIAVLLAIVAAASSAMIIFRTRLLAYYDEFDCVRFTVDEFANAWNCQDQMGASIWWDYGFAAWSRIAHLAMIVGPIFLGAFAAAPIFTQEFAHVTHVFALTQSIGKRRWFATKIVVLATPLTAGLLLLGFLLEWMDYAIEVSVHNTLDPINFFARSIVPAGTGLMAFGLAIAAAMLTRNMMASLVTAIIAGGAVLFGVAVIQPHVLPAERTITPLSEIYAPVGADGLVHSQFETGDSFTPLDSVADTWMVGTGYLDPTGKEISAPDGRQNWYWVSPCYDQGSMEAAHAVGLQTDEYGGIMISDAEEEALVNSAQYTNAFNAVTLECMTQLGIDAEYTDILPGTILWPLRATITGILVALAALFTGLGAWRMRWAVAKR